VGVLSDTETKMQVRRASDLAAPPIPTWLARGYVPRNEITVLVGEEGIGKSLTWVVLAAHITTGVPFPAFNLPARKPRDVVLIITEDSWGEVKARLEVAGADLSRIHLFSEAEDGSGSPIFPEHQDVLYKWVAASGISPALIVVDAWLDTVDPGLQVRNTQHGRLALAPWKTIATRLATSVLLVTHTNRMDTGNTRDLLGSTVALRQKARMILFAARHPEDGNDGRQHVWIGPEKSNTTGPVNAVKFTLNIEQHRVQTDDDPGTVATLIQPEDAGATIRQLVSDWRRDQQSADREPSKAEQAEGWLLAFMAGKQAVMAREVQEAGRAAGFGDRSVRVAMGKLGTSKPAAPGAPWLYSLQSVQRSGNTPKSADTADTANTGLHEPLSMQSVQTAQSQQRYPSTANTGSAA
jgi:hypothetical protein